MPVLFPLVSLARSHAHSIYWPSLMRLTAFRHVLMPTRFFKISAFLWPTGAFVPFTLSFSREILYPCSFLLPFQSRGRSYLSPIFFRSLPTCCLSFSLKWRLMRCWRGLPRLNRFHARMSHRRPPSCSKSATWSPS